MKCEFGEYKEGSMLGSHLRRLFKIRVLSSSLIGAFGLLAFSSGVSSLPALASSPATSPVHVSPGGVTVNSAPAWLATATPYVHVKNYLATIDPRLAQVLSAGELAAVRENVSRYNASPIATRTVGVTHTVSISSRMAASAAYSACNGYMSVNSYNWWGVQFYMNDCFAQDLALGVGVAAAASLLLLLVPGIDVAVAVLTSMLAIASGSILWADHHCGSNGAYLNVPWLPAYVWGSSIC